MAIASGPTTTGVQGVAIPKFNIFGTPQANVKLLLEACPDDSVIVGPTAKGLLPGMYKLKELKDVPGVGMSHKLEVSSQIF